MALTNVQQLDITLPAGSKQQVMLINPTRVSALLVNDSDTTIYIQLGSEGASANAGIRLNASGGSYEINLNNPWYGEVWAYCAAAKVLLVTEVSYGTQ